MSQSELNVLYAAFESALNAADYSTALLKLVLIKARIASGPIEVERGTAGGGSSSFILTPNGVDALFAEVRALQTAAAHATTGPWVSVPVDYVRPTASGDYE